MNTYKKILTALLFITANMSLAVADDVTIRNLLVEYEQRPMGIETLRPRFSWQMADKDHSKGQCQKAYRIVVEDEYGKRIWDSGKVESDESLNIVFGGEKLAPATSYTWTVEVWDNKDNVHTASSTFETGLMANDENDAIWNGAQWIGTDDDDQFLYSQYLPVFSIGCSVTLDKQRHSTKASILYGGNDERLLDSHLNIMGIKNKIDSTYIRVELDASRVENGELAHLNIFRKGYGDKETGEKQIWSVEIPAGIVNNDNVFGTHRIELSSNLGDTNIKIDGKHLGRANLNPLGQGGDFIAFPVLGEVGVYLEKGQKARFSDFVISNYRSPSGKIGKVASLDTCGVGLFVMTDPSIHTMPRLRRALTIHQEIAKARLYVTSRGVYEFYVNGQRVGDDWLNPGITQYNRTHLYQIYDVTPMLKVGENAIGAILGEGWWSGGATFEGQNWNYFGDRLSLLAKLTIYYKDGSVENIVTDPHSWKYSVDGALIYSSLFQGEVYDARKDDHNWTTSGYADATWKQAVVIPTIGHVSSTGWGNGPAVDDYSHFRLIAQYGQTISKNRTIRAQAVKRTMPKSFIYDMGQNMVGVPQIKFSGLTPGTKIRFRYAEILYPELPEYEGKEGTLMLENIRAAMAQDIYIAKGGEETFKPFFTNHGYRYIEISGIEEELPLDNVEGIVLSSIKGIDAQYETSSELINKLWSNITWSTLGNFVSIPTDCPQRNERLGWAGDISVFSRTASYMASIPQFLRRYLQSMRDVQRADGRMPDIAPLGGGFGGLLWGSASITVAWESYQQYNDKRMLEEHYDAMKKYIDFIFKKTIDPQTNIIVQDNAWGDLGDWLGLEDEKNDKSLFWEAYLIYDLDIMRKTAALLGKADDEKYFADKRQERIDFFNNTYLEQATGKTISSGFGGREKGQLVDTQTSYVLPVALGVLDGKTYNNCVSNLAETIERQGIMDNGSVCAPYALLTGFIGTAWISKALSDGGRSDIAYKLLLNEQYPSWLYPVKQGATTIWERLNSYTHSNGFGGNNRMNSFNHYSFGAVGAWLINYSLGIRRDETSPGFKHFIIKPEVDPTGKLKYAKGHYDSPYGRIESGWTVESGRTEYEITVPSNTTTTLILPAHRLKDIYEGGRIIGKGSKGIVDIKFDKGYAMLELQSGKYHFSVIKRIADVIPHSNDGDENLKNGYNSPKSGMSEYK